MAPGRGLVEAPRRLRKSAHPIHGHAGGVEGIRRQRRARHMLGHPGKYLPYCWKIGQNRERNITVPDGVEKADAQSLVSYLQSSRPVTGEILLQPELDERI